MYFQGPQEVLRCLDSLLWSKRDSCLMWYSMSIELPFTKNKFVKKQYLKCSDAICFYLKKRHKSTIYNGDGLKIRIPCKTHFSRICFIKFLHHIYWVHTPDSYFSLLFSFLKQTTICLIMQGAVLCPISFACRDTPKHQFKDIIDTLN